MKTTRVGSIHLERSRELLLLKIKETHGVLRNKHPLLDFLGELKGLEVA